MSRPGLLIALLSLIAVHAGSHPARADDEPAGNRLSCQYDPSETSSCAPYACVPDVPPGTDENMIAAGTAGFCGRCPSDRFCGGAACKSNGLCAVFDPSPRPEPVWPHFHLLVTDAAINLFDRPDPKPMVSAGYVFQGAFAKTTPERFDGHGYLTSDLPRWYWNVGGVMALAGPAQNLFVDAGLTRYLPSAPLFVTTLALGVEYQRQGASIWRVTNGQVNDDRVGPALSVGFLQNAFVRVAYVFPLRGPTDQGAVILGVSYMKDLLADLVPDRLKRFLPAQFK